MKKKTNFISPFNSFLWINPHKIGWLGEQNNENDEIKCETDRERERKKKFETI